MSAGLGRGGPARRLGRRGTLLVDAAFTARTDHPFPLGILAIHVGGALALGVVAGAALEGEALVIVAGGGIGSFTTFSTWILDSHRLA